MISLKESLKEVIETLDKRRFNYALAGGLVASLYRKDLRATQDIDLLLYTKGNVIDDAKDVLKFLSLRPEELRSAQLRGGPLHQIKSKSTPVVMLCGLPTKENQIRIDFLLHTLPWVTKALERSQSNIQDLFGLRVPCISVEDVILAKLYAVDFKATRFKDLDDLQSILQNEEVNIDWTYIGTSLKQMSLKIPEVIKEHFPATVQRMVKLR